MLQPQDPPSCSVMFWNEGGGGGMEGKKHAVTQDPPSCSVMFWNGVKGWGGWWRVRNILQLKVALQKILPAAASSSGMKGWEGRGGG